MILILRQIWNDIRRGENIDLYITVAIAIPLATLSIFGIQQLSSWVAPLTLAVLALFAVSLLVNRQKMDVQQERNDKSTTAILEKLHTLAEKEQSGVQKLYLDANDENFVRAVRELIQKAHEIRIYSIAISVLWNHQTFSLLKEAIETRRAKVTIFIANSKSAQIKQRLKEEEKYNDPAPKGPQLIDRIFIDLKKLEEAVGDTAILDVRQFDHYPTFTLIIIDSDIFYYPYGYQTLGNVAPVFHLKNDNSRQANYFLKQFGLLVKNYPRPTSNAGG